VRDNSPGLGATIVVGMIGFLLAVAVMAMLGRSFSCNAYELATLSSGRQETGRGTG
jgi:hypothetical protein